MGFLLFLVVCCAAVAQTVTVAANRLTSVPILSPRPGWMSVGVFNPAAAKLNGKTVLLFRAQDDRHTSRIGYAEATDGLNFTVRADPVLSPEAEYEKNGGVEDPRLLQVEGAYYLTYTGYDGHSAQLCLATSKDLIHWERKGVILPAYKGTWNEQWTKSGAIVPNKIGGKWWMYYLGTRKDVDGKARDYMGLAQSDDLLHWQDATKEPVLPRRAGAFDSRVMEPGAPPFLTDKGILLLYNGANEQLVYGPGWALFDREHPERLIARSEKAFVTPSLPWEKFGNVPNVIFMEGEVGSLWDMVAYYGAADKYIGALHVQISVR
jgi:beta-1,2-mannosidase